MEPMVISKTDFREITPDTLLEDDRVSFFPIIPTLFAGFLAGFLFEAYGEDDPEGETFLVNDDEVMTEDACGRFYDRNWRWRRRRSKRIYSLSGHAEEYIEREPFAHQEEDLNDEIATRLVDEPGDGEREYNGALSDSEEDDMEPTHVLWLPYETVIFRPISWLQSWILSKPLTLFDQYFNKQANILI